MLGNFLFNLANFCVIVSYLTKLLTLDVLISTVVRPVVVVAKLIVIVGILPLTSFILALREVFVIIKVKNTVPYTYVINDLTGE